ncbi:MAG: helix-turn-helix transcriptional regulator [Lachnospiraceae bacterium]|nr:helix-turn-helix transcriptional regulator [Lachnospiraceae bacterium]
MVRIKICELMGKRKMTRKHLSELTGIRPNTIGDLYREDVKKIDIQALDKICKVIECDICDVLEYVPDDKKPGEKND